MQYLYISSKEEYADQRAFYTNLHVRDFIYG